MEGLLNQVPVFPVLSILEGIFFLFIFSDVINMVNGKFI